jgi:hypothetical protein
VIANITFLPISRGKVQKSDFQNSCFAPKFIENCHKLTGNDIKQEFSGALLVSIPKFSQKTVKIIKHKFFLQTVVCNLPSTLG